MNYDTVLLDILDSDASFINSFYITHKNPKMPPCLTKFIGDT